MNTGLYISVNHQYRMLDHVAAVYKREHSLFISTLYRLFKIHSDPGPAQTSSKVGLAKETVSELAHSSNNYISRDSKVAISNLHERVRAIKRS